MTGVRTGMEMLGMGFLLAAADAFLDAYLCRARCRERADSTTLMAPDYPILVVDLVDS